MSFGMQVLDTAGRVSFDSANGGIIFRGSFDIRGAASGSYTPQNPQNYKGKLVYYVSAILKSGPKYPSLRLVGGRITWTYRWGENVSTNLWAHIRIQYGWA